MKVSKITTIRNKVRMAKGKIRVICLRLQGMNIGRGTVLGPAGIVWPKNISIGEMSTLEDFIDFRISHPFSENNKIIIGDRVFIGRCSEFNCGTNITIGNDVMIASKCSFFDVSHDTEGVNLYNENTISKPITVGNNVWIGTGTIILLGVEIGDNSVIGAGSVIRRSVPPNEIWAGVPAEFIRNCGSKDK
ncbi:acyltransferase [Luteolibacter sp. AS25]|uniref:acyltransferase n=1 Tax=Luteolibacter sp. AS25 TaxID=3135776 RepID=UPI00398A6753